MAEKTLEKLDQTGAAIITQLDEFSKKGIEFIETQAPEVCQELVLLGRAQYTTIVVASVILFIFCVVWLKLLRKESDNYKWDFHSTFPEVFCIIRHCVAIIGIVAGPILVCTWARDMIVAWVAPRIYLIEYFSKLLGLMKGK